MTRALLTLMLAAGDLPAPTQAPRPPVQDGGIVKIGGPGGSSYEGRYGQPVHWPLSEMARGVYPPGGQSFWTQGLLLSFGQVRLCLEDESFCLPLSPVPEIANVFFDAAIRTGDGAKVIGVFGADPVTAGATTAAPPPPPGRPDTASAPTLPGRLGPSLLFWSLESGPGFKRQTAPAGSILEALILRPERFEGQTVTVQGRFRGGNLFDDLPPESRRGASDWVLREGPFSVWVTGRVPRGKGWRLDPASRTDTAWRVEVDARVVRRNGLVFLEARQVRLVQREPDSSP